MACEWVEKFLKEVVPKDEEFVLICDNLTAQVSDDFKTAVRKINGIVYFGPPGMLFIYSSIFIYFRGYSVKQKSIFENVKFFVRGAAIYSISISISCTV